MPKKNIDESLFEFYQHDTLIGKVTVLKGFIDNFDGFFELIQGQNKTTFRDPKAVANILKAEIHYTMFHALETMFAICMALLKDPDHVWVWLSSYKFSTFNGDIAMIAENGISSISDKDEIETITYLFFKNTPPDFLENEDVQKGIHNIARILKLCAKEFINKDEYNSYKHGLRLVRGECMIQRVDDSGKKSEIIGELPCNMYLDPKSLDLPQIIIKPFSYERDFEIIRLCWQLTRLMIKQRKAEFEEERGIEKTSEIKTLDFSKIDVDKLFEPLPGPFTSDL